MPNRGRFKSGRSAIVPTVVTTDPRLTDPRPPSGSDFSGGELANTGVSAATYGDATDVAQITVDAKGRITAASNVAISAGGGPDPTTSFAEIDDFVGGGITAGAIGKLGWTPYNGLIDGYQGGDDGGIFGHAGPGTFQLDTNSTASVFTRIQLAPEGQFAIWSTRFDVIFYLAFTNADANLRLRIGLMDTGAADPAFGAYFEKLEADTDLFGVTANGAGQTRTATLGPSALNGNFHRLRVREVSSGHVGFSVDGGSELVNTTHVTTGVLNLVIQLYATNISYHDFTVDYVWIKIASLVR